MKQREIGLAGLGLVVGLVLGVLLTTATGGGLFGTAGFNAAAPPAYYLVDLESSQDWLLSTYPSQTEAISSSFGNVAEILTNPNFPETVRAVQPDINRLIGTSYTALTGIGVPDSFELQGNPLLSSLSDGNVSSCLGLDENPYNIDGYNLYLYLEIPSTQTEFVPATWERLNNPKLSDLFWQLLACQSMEQAQGTQRR